MQQAEKIIFQVKIGQLCSLRNFTTLQISFSLILHMGIRCPLYAHEKLELTKKKFLFNSNSVEDCEVVQGEEEWLSKLEQKDKATLNAFLPRFKAT